MGAVIGSGLSLVAGPDGGTGDIDGDGMPEYFRERTSNEGVHFTVWTGTPLRAPGGGTAQSCDGPPIRRVAPLPASR